MGCEQVQAKNLSLVYKKRTIRRTAVEFQLWICLEELAKERGRKRGREGERSIGEGRRKGSKYEGMGWEKERTIRGGEPVWRTMEGRISEISEPRRMQFHWSVGCVRGFVRMT